MPPLDNPSNPILFSNWCRRGNEGPDCSLFSSKPTPAAVGFAADAYSHLGAHSGNHRLQGRGGGEGGGVGGKAQLFCSRKPLFFTEAGPCQQSWSRYVLPHLASRPFQVCPRFYFWVPFIHPHQKNHLLYKTLTTAWFLTYNLLFFCVWIFSSCVSLSYNVLSVWLHT